MRISDIATETGVSPATLKYYIREGLVPEGERVGTNRTDYSDAHVQRVRLVRALLDTGKLSVAATRDVLNALDSNDDFGPALEAAQHALERGRPSGSAESRERIVALAAAQGWVTHSTNPGVDAAARALDGFAVTGAAPSDDYLTAYAESAALLARADLAALAELVQRGASDSVVEYMVVGTIMGDDLVAGLRRIAQEHEATHAASTASAPGATTTASTTPISATRKETP